jgi:hypothetical protein
MGDVIGAKQIDSGSSTTEVLVPLAGNGHPCKTPNTLWALTRETKGAGFRSREVLFCHQESCISTDGDIKRLIVKVATRAG